MSKTIKMVYDRFLIRYIDY